MPISGYDPLFGGKAGSAQEAKTAMLKKYGVKKGTSVFYSLVNKRRQQQGSGIPAPGSRRARSNP